MRSIRMGVDYKFITMFEWGREFIGFDFGQIGSTRYPVVLSETLADLTEAISDSIYGDMDNVLMQTGQRLEW